MHDERWFDDDGAFRPQASPWHPGETAIQEQVGVAARMAEVGRRVVRDFMPEQHRAFFAQLPFLVAGSVDPQGDAWATLIAGAPGFVAAPGPRALTIAARPDPGDPASLGLREGEAIGLLGIELHTRRRNRVNGVIRGSAEGLLRVEVEQSFGNCPQYIQLRDGAAIRDPQQAVASAVEESAALDEAARATIAAADTFFVASYAEQGGHRQVDVSHRGGKAGFVRVAADGTLTIPDFAGNLFFATLGNILLNGKAGLVFADFATGDLLQLTGDAEIVLSSPEIAAFQGAERLWTVRPRRVVRRRGALPRRWTFRPDGWSPNSLMTGDWREAADRLRAADLATRWRPFTVTRIVDESRTIRSFHLRPADGAGLVPHRAGQHLPIRVTLPGQETPVIRTYTLSVAPSDATYRISVKRDGAVSRHLHETLRVGDEIEARAPAGGFTIDAQGRRPAVLLAGGVGITPLLAMLRHVVYEGLRTGASGRPFWSRPPGPGRTGPSPASWPSSPPLPAARCGSCGCSASPATPSRGSITTSPAGSTGRCWPASCRSAMTTSISAARPPSRKDSMTPCAASTSPTTASTPRRSAPPRSCAAGRRQPQGRSARPPRRSRSRSLS